MKKATFLSVLITVACSIYANTNAISNSKDSSLLRFSDVHDLLQQIINVTGLTENFELKEANVLNIEATITHGKRYILYNPAFITSINNVTKNKWSVMTLLAHEVGHHLNGHTMHRGGSKPRLELEADEFAGFILHKLGATLEQSQNVMYYIAREKGSKTHPSKDARLLAIEKGWDNAGLQEATAKQ